MTDDPRAELRESIPAESPLAAYWARHPKPQPSGQRSETDLRKLAAELLREAEEKRTEAAVPQ